MSIFKLLFGLVLGLLFSFNSFAQGTLTGTITDKNNEPLIGVTVLSKADKSKGTITDFDGKYSIKIADSTAQLFIFSYVGFDSVEFSVQVKNNEVVEKSITMTEASKTLQEVQVVGKATKAKEYYMENVKKNSSSSIDFISAETIKKTGDANVTNAAARVSGVSTAGGFITVRGIGDRYVKTTINGSQIPTLDPFTNNIKLDLIPSSLIDNLILTKTATADLPGDWAGAYISVETKDYPEKFTINCESSLGYNAQTTFKNVLASEKSSTDWLGYDNNYREYNHNNFVEVTTPTKYQELSALGLESYFKSQGITEETPWNDTYYKLALVELGLLNKSDFDNLSAVSAAKVKYEQGDYSEKAYEAINGDAVKSNKAFKNNWHTFNKKAPMNFSQSFSIGNQTKLFGKPLGIIAGFRYNNMVQYDANSVSYRTDRQGVDANGDIFKTQTIDQQISRYTNGWSALVNLAYKYHPNHSISYLFMPNFLGVNSIRDGIDSILTRESPNYYNSFYKSQFYEERKQIVNQLKSEHFLPKSKVKIEFNGSYTKGESSVPDFKNLKYFEDDSTNYLLDLTESDIRRNYRYLTENMLDLRLFAERPIFEKEGFIRKVKIGASSLYATRLFNQFDYLLNLQGTDLEIKDNDIEEYFNTDKFGIDTASGTIKYFFTRAIDPSNKSIGYSKVNSGFALIDYSFTQKFRTTGGIRLEHTNLMTDAYEFNSLGYKKDDQRRYTPNYILVNPTSLKQYNVLPSAGIIYKIVADEQKPMLVRLNYSKSIARPSLREYSKSLMFDFELNAYVMGNDTLKIVEINNYDFRFEKYFKSGDNVSLSVFYKDLKNHIEIILNPGFPAYTWFNANESNVKGIEFEVKKYIIKNLEFKSNVTLVKSESRIQLNDTNTIVRAMAGQAPYVLNGMLSYSFDSLKLVTTVSYNVQGPRLVFAGLAVTPDVFEMPRHMIDIKLTKNIGKYFGVSFTVRDILNATIKRAYKFGDSYKLVYDTYRFGTNYVLSIFYKF
jgi:TonB-dependent receptor